MTRPFTLRHEVPRDKPPRARFAHRNQSEISPKSSRNPTGLSLANHSRSRNLRNFLLRLFLFAALFVFASHAQHHATITFGFEIPQFAHPRGQPAYFAFFFVAFGFNPLTYS